MLIGGFGVQSTAKDLQMLLEKKLEKAKASRAPARIAVDSYSATDNEIVLNLSLADLRDLLNRREVIVSSESDTPGKYASYTIRLRYKARAPRGVKV